jgi:YidC/Oxa1 family membrane protein insertase
MDRNQGIGLVLITTIMVLYFIYTANQPQRIVTSQKDTTAIVQKEKSAETLEAPAIPDSILNQKFGAFSAGMKGEEKQFTIENKEVEITFNSKGGKVERVLLKKYFTDDKKPLYIVDKRSSRMNFLVSTPTGEINLSDLYYTQSKTDSSVSYKLAITEDKYIEHVYTLPKTGYVLNYELKLEGLDNLIKNEPVKFNWITHLPKVERDLKLSRTSATVNYYFANGEFDYLSETSEEEEIEKLNTPVKWVSMKQKFFSAGIIAKNNFEKGLVRSEVVATDTIGVKDLEASLTIPIGDLQSGKGQYQFYFGPNKYDILKQVTDGFDKNVFLGWPVINWINRFVVIPVFNFLEGFIGNYGIIIIILVILLKLILFPLSYKSYISMAKMKVLKPEIDAIKEKHEGDMQKSQMETMELYKKVGINPLSGCIPVLLQMPILLAMFNFFPNSIELRQEAFLWAHDLSTYDALFTWDAQIPLLSKFYGNHFSLFTFLMTISTLVYTWYNNQVSTVTGPMKTVSYAMPIVFMFVLNSFPAGLSFYYFVSNIVTIAQQAIIRKFVDEDKIKNTLDENRKKISANPKKSQWMNRIEEAMKAKEAEKKKKKK